MLEKDIQEVLFSQQQLEERVDQIAQEITRDYAGKEIVLISVLRGSFVFMADLCRRIDLPCTIDFMSVSSYGSGTSSTGQVQICLLYTSPSPRDGLLSRMPSSA